MELRKRTQQTVISSSDGNKRKKLQMTAININRSSRESITHLENLSNELIFEILEFLDFYDVYKAFFNLNIRFQNLLTDSTLPIKINISSMSKPTFQPYYTDIIMPNTHQITSLRLLNPCVINTILSPPKYLPKFTRLKTLILEHTESKYLKKLLGHLVSSSNLVSLVINCVDEFTI